MATPRFTPLHVHSHYSLLEGVDSLDALLARAAACGYQDLALTDSNNLYGAVAFVEAAAEARRSADPGRLSPTWRRAVHGAHW